MPETCRIPSPSPPILTVENVCYHRQNKSILHNISLEIIEGDFISLIGPNGAGKSTLLKILLGIEQPNSGMVKRHRPLKIGYMPQKLSLDGLMPITVERFLRLAHRHLENTKQTISNVVEQVEIKNIIHKPLTGLSGGERQRVLLARALLGEPHILMLDEPVQNLDVHGQLHFYKLLETLYKTHTIIMVSHDLHMVMRATRKVVCLFGHICCEGAPEAVSVHPKFVELFGQDMSKMLKIYQHEHSHEH